MKRMVVPTSEPVAASDLGDAEGGGTRKLRLDEMLAERDRPPLPPAPVLTVDPAPVDAAPVDGLRGTLFDHDSLLDEYSRRLRDEQESQARAHGELVRAEEALRIAERNLEVATESARRRGDDDAAKFEKLEAEWREACIQRDRATAELRQLTMGDGELVRVRRELEAAREDMNG